MSEQESLNQKALHAKHDEGILNDLISEHRKFILGVAYHTTGHYVSESDDVFSIGLIAFHEAVRRYDETKGDFRAFAGIVIRRRILDQLKSEGKYEDELPVSIEVLDGDFDEDSVEKDMGQAVLARHTENESAMEQRKEESRSIKDEIECMQGILKQYGFSFYDLSKCSPKAQKTKDACAEVVAVLLEKEELFAEMRRTKMLPAAELIKISGVPRKIIDRHRKYIIAAAEILHGEYPMLAEYMNFIRQAMWRRV